VDVDDDLDGRVLRAVHRPTARSRHASTQRASSRYAPASRSNSSGPSPREASGHLGEHLRGEAAVFLGGELEEVLEPVALFDRCEVDEVARLGASEHREHLVDGQLLAAQRRCGLSLLDREEPCAGPEVELGAVTDRPRRSAAPSRGSPEHAERSIPPRFLLSSSSVRTRPNWG
jgi:hypothetical protein